VIGLVERAEAMATALRVEEDLEADPPVIGIRASTSIRDTVPPCLLVVPVPALDFTGVLDGDAAADVEWTIVALAQPPADLEAARELDYLLTHVAETLDVTRADPASYQIPTAETKVPAYLITVNEPA
jgi:hypothetical protein